MERLYASYNDDIEFLIVYIREAHPEMLKEGNKTGIVGRPKSLDERVILATECVSKYKFTMPMVIDGMDGKVNSDYQAAPVRVTVTDIDGKVAFYAGRGPSDFRLPPVERTLKKLIANGGRMPPPPVPQWSRPVNGLRCGLIIDPEEFTVGEQVVVQLKFDNTTNKSINLYYKSTDALKRIAIDNGNGQTLELQSAGGRSSRRRGRSGSPIQTIAPGQAFETEIEAKIIAGPGKETFAAGQFHAVYNLEVNDETLAQVEPAPEQAVWTGKLTSGKYALSVNSAPPVGCADCHGGEDYHHKLDEDCEGCHVGEVGTDEFDVKKEACGQCHPREGVQGRRQILGPGGEFEMASRHIPGKLEDKHCLMCHDNSKHRNGVVSLIDPDSEGTEPWTGSRTDFCLTCHDGEPPEGVSFPTQFKGTGFDKMMFLGSRLSQTKEGCSYCHLPHGSPYPSLLKNLHAH
ncbi:MAG: hypothetical protein CEE38_05560 [Planctomycetes bacterium B3_Pla]|nr:MAG: hypothetical protein CEE38_05560 [Planctomycetes bacterium B3_Pla]